MSNPFADWRDDQQCRDTWARDSVGLPTFVSASKARQWCVLGWLRREGVGTDLVIDFNLYVQRQNHGWGLSLINDDRNWTPADFRRAWDEFIESRAK